MATRPLRRRPVVFVALLAAAPVAAACNASEHVDLAFKAPPGSRAGYVITIDSVVETRLGGPAERTEERVVLEARQRVLGGDGEDAVDLEIRMGRPDRRERVFEVRLDTRRGLAAVDTVEGLPVEALGELGPSRLVLLASGLLPTRAVRPGETWDLERDLELPEGVEHLSGRGRLAGLERDGSTDLARVEARTTLPVARTMTLEQGRVRLRGEERTEAVLDYAVADGTVHAARSVTTGTFDLVVTPPSGASALEGTLEVRVESRTRRQDLPRGAAGVPAESGRGEVRPQHHDEVGLLGPRER